MLSKLAFKKHRSYSFFKKASFRTYKNQGEGIYTLKTNDVILYLIYDSVLKTMGKNLSGMALTFRKLADSQEWIMPGSWRYYGLC